MACSHKIAALLLALIAGASSARAEDKVTFAVAFKGLSIAPVFVAYDSGAFKQHGIDADLAFLNGGPSEVAALLAGDAQFGIGANDAMLDLVKTAKVTCIYTYTNAYTQDLMVRNEIVEARKITRDLDWKERVRRLKGVTVGVIALGTTTDMAGRRLWEEAGLDYRQDMVIVRVGATPAQMAALKQGSIDAFLASAPARQMVEAQKLGSAVIQFGDVPSWADEPFEGILVRRDYLAGHSDIARRVVAAIVDAQRMILADPKQAAVALKKGTFADLDMAILESALTQMKSAFRLEKMTAERWNQLRDSRALVNGALSGITIKEGEDWTNQFYPQ
jgi:ABC-type nitrate/sulfonate/bicarbonate transport system substrate-binding protein